MVARYGMAEVLTWYWEVWNEPDIFYWHGTEKEYNRLYDYAVAGVRASDSGGAGRRPSDHGAFTGEQERDVPRGVSAALRAGSKRSDRKTRFRWTLFRFTPREVHILWTAMCRWGWAASYRMQRLVSK